MLDFLYYFMLHAFQLFEGLYWLSMVGCHGSVWECALFLFRLQGLIIKVISFFSSPL